MGELWRRLVYLIHRRRMSTELESDMQFHREMAAREGRNNFGNELRMRERAREAWGWMWLDRLAQDLRYGARILVRSPGFTLLAVLVLAVGIGVNVSAFSLFDMVALKPLPVRDPGSLVRLERRSPNNYASEMAYPSFEFYRDHARTLSAAMAVLGVPPMQLDNDLQSTSASFVTANYFTELGTRPELGRLLDPGLDAHAEAAPVVVLSYGLWQRRFGGDASIVGQTIRLNKKHVTVVGVTPFAFASLGGQHPDVWMPIAEQPYFVSGSKVLTDWTNSSVRMWGRLAPGVTAEAAEQELKRLTDAIRQLHPDAVWDNERLQSSPGGHLQVMKPEMYQVAAMVAVLTLLILAVSCANLGGLMLARAVKREHEIGIRIAIGAGRSRIFRQLCTESLLLATLGSVVGLALGAVILQVTLTEMDAPKWLSAMPDWRVLLFTAGTTLASAVFFGLAPALRIARQKQNKTIARQLLVGAQVAASCVLLIVAGLLVRATQHALYTDPGFGYEHLMTVDAQLAQHGYTPAAAEAFLSRMQSRLQAVPGVQSVSLVKLPPMGHVVSREGLVINGHPVQMYPNWVAPGFFKTMEIPLLLGRTFYAGEKNAVIVSEQMAREQWPGENPLGKLVGEGDTKDVVVGVAGDAHINALSDDDATEQYWPAQRSDMPGMVLVVRASGDPSGLPKTVRAISENLDPNLIPEIRQVKQLYREDVSHLAQVATVVSLIGGVAVLLAGVGILGLVAYVVSQRLKEIAIRIALGAKPAQVLSAVLRQFRWPVVLGLLAGTGISAAASKVLRKALFGVSNLDPVGYGTAILILVAILALAALLPARRALRLDLARTLHYD
jgi:putative ABC transport system permease protein